MGLLDDAIREHLDLKRARGGDPAEIERLEREALGPVRREPTIGSTRFEVADHREPDDFGPEGLEPEYREDHLEDLEELQERGYHDSMAPHPHPEHRHAEPRGNLDEPRFMRDREDLGIEPEEEQEQPRRRFLRRNRGSAPSEPVSEPGFHEDDLDLHSYDPLDHRDHLDEDEEPFDEYGDPEPPREPGSPPPQVQFERPPKRPRFTAEPPSPEPATDDGPGSDKPGAQETTEFDVQKHIAETRHLPDEDVPQTRRPPADADYHADEQKRDSGTAHDAEADPEADEDVLEETPEFLQDTPEHDRLWFEQRPPKDFDFDG